MPAPTIPQPASTVVLVRPVQSGGFEIFMNRRPEKIDVYAGIYVFPGGRVEKSDYSSAMLQLTHGLSATDAQQQLGVALEPGLAVGYWVAAVRELFEEAGVHFFVPQDAADDPSPAAGLEQRLQMQRVLLQQGSIDLA